MTGGDVTKLQELLAKDKELYPEGKVTGKFGPLTEEAVKRFQKKYDLKCADTTYCGYIGPATRNKLNELY
jgi:peptidoglycan hydrolase-like protein with peptidoglycan-binding domain